MDNIIMLILKAMAIGLIISAPMGPIGVLCIQRTLNRGRAIGFYTGVGAAISDILYCLLTAFGLSFVEDFLMRNQTIITLLGSVVLLGFALYLFRSNPAKSIRQNSGQRTSPKSSILTGFLFTFSNPLIVFLIMGLYARFSFLGPDFKFYHHILAFLFIIIGALLWWYVVTYFVNKIRAHFNLRSIWLINRITGSIILAFSAVGLYTSIHTLLTT